MPAHAVSAAEVAARTRPVWEESGGRFTLGIGSGAMRPAAAGMRSYMAELRPLLPGGAPVHLAAMGPRMLQVAGETASGAMLNWGSADRNAWSAERVREAAGAAGRRQPEVMSYVRVCCDEDEATAHRAAAKAMLGYAINVPAYRALFVEMGFAGELADLERLRESGATADELAGAVPPPMLRAVCAYGTPAQVREGFERIGAPLDLAVVRVVNARPGDPAAARAALEACRP